MTFEDNPYRWDSHNPDRPVQRSALLDRARELALRGESGYLLGCRGMGKSVFLRQLLRDLQQQPDVDLFLFQTPGADATVPGWIQAVGNEMAKVMEQRGATELVGKLERFATRRMLRELFETYLEAAPASLERLVLIYDELDAYGSSGRCFFNELEDIRKNSNGRIVIFAAGGLGIAALDTLLGSSFFSRMTAWILDPFGHEQIVQLAAPFEARGSPLSSDVLEALRLASGGNAALATYGLQHLWRMQAPEVHDVATIFAQFRAERSLDFLKSIRGPLFESNQSDAPLVVWREINRSAGQMTRMRMRDLIRNSNGSPTVKKPEWVLRMLRSSGFIRCSDDAHLATDIEVEIIPSILTLDIDDERMDATTIREQLIVDISEVLDRIHRMSVDFFRGERKGKREILPEALFSAVLCLGLNLRDWRTEREAQSAAGRTDIKARHRRFGEQSVVIEVKIWDRNDYEDIHKQVVSYWTKGVVALATVMVSDLHGPDWPDRYAEKCLKRGTVQYTQKDVTGVLAGHFVAQTGTAEAPEVDHMLLRLARR